MSSSDLESFATMAVESRSASVQAEGTTAAACPKCGVRVIVHRILNANVDSSGFENYFLKCNQCSVWLIGVVDPYDEALLLTELKDEGKT
jgi:hypothetical protein